MRSVYNIVYDTDHRGHCTMDMHIPKTDHETVLIYLHGGGLEGGDKSDFSSQLRPLTASGIAVYSVNYRLYPDCAFPDYARDAALAVSKIVARHPGAKFCIAGSSAGAYIAMLLCFDARYLSRHDIDPARISGWVFDAGQPTTHFRVLKERGLSENLIRVDEGAPLYFVSEQAAQIARGAKHLFLCADGDIPGRLEQNMMMVKTMRLCGFDEVDMQVIEGSGHCQYVDDERFTRILLEFVQQL